MLYTDGQPTLIIVVCALFREVYVPKHTFWLTCAVHRWQPTLIIAVCALFREVYVPKHTFWLTCAVHRRSAHLDHCSVCPLQRGVCTKAYLLVDLCCTQMVSPPLHHLTALPKLQSRLGRKERDRGQHHL